jgi:hypothetical protein
LLNGHGLPFLEGCIKIPRTKVLGI